LALGSGGLTLAVLGLSQGNEWGWSANATLISLAVGVGGLAWFIRHELRTDAPMIELRVFTHRYFRLAMGAMLFVTMAQFGRVVYSWPPLLSPEWSAPGSAGDCWTASARGAR
jgi:hypothetical protein